MIQARSTTEHAEILLFLLGLITLITFLLVAVHTPETQDVARIKDDIGDHGRKRLDTFISCMNSNLV